MTHDPKTAERPLARPMNAAQLAAGVGIEDDKEWLRRRMRDLKRAERIRQGDMIGRLDRWMKERRA